MANERDDRWRVRRDEPSMDDENRRSRDRDQRGGWGGSDREERGYGRDRGENWFSGGRDDDRERGYRSERGDDWFSAGRGDSWFSGSRERDRDYDRDRDEPRGSQPMRWTSSNRDYREDYQRGAQGSGRYRPVTGDSDRGARGRGRDDFERRDYDRASEWQRDPYRRTSFAGSAASSNYQDPPYDEWRRRQMEEMDREYDDYRRESRSRFEQDFGEWREQRQQKRGLLGKIREHMEVVGRDGEHVGTIDRVAGDRLILTKSDPESGGTHHSISCTMVDRVDNDEVVLEVDAYDARKRWRDEDRERPLSEEQGRDEKGPHVLDRSFSGTYR